MDVNAIVAAASGGATSGGFAQAAAAPAAPAAAAPAAAPAPVAASTENGRVKASPLAKKLAAEKGVRFATRQENIAEMVLPPKHYALIASVFCHFAEPVRTQVLQRMIDALQPGGMFAGVFYHPDQIALGTGGPKDAAMLGTLNEMQQALAGLEWLIAEHEEIGRAHV